MKQQTNLIEPLFDLIWDTGKLVKDLIIDSFNIFNKKESVFNFKEYFDIVKLYKEINEEKVYPTLINKYDTVKGEKYVFSIPIGLGKDYIKNFKDSLECALGYKLEFSFEGKNWIIEVCKNSLKSNVRYIKHNKSKDKIEIYLGESLEGDVKINLKENPNTFIVGTTGSGKSVCTKSIITSLVTNYKPYELQLYLCDLKRVELNLFRNLKHVKAFEYDVFKVNEVIKEVFEICEERYTTLMEHNLTSIFQYNKMFPNKKMPFIILYVEEIVLLLKDKKKEGMFYLKELLPICRACGVYTFITTQRPSADVIDNVVKANINNRICFKVEDEKNSYIAIDTLGGENLKGKGHGILKVGSNKIEFQGYFISDEDVQNYIKNHLKTEELNSTSKQLGFKENKKENEIDNLDFLEKL